MVILSSVATAHAQLNEHCTVSILNRTARVRADGTWKLPNVPATNQGVRVRARATCTENGVTRSGQSSYVLLTPNRTFAFDSDIALTTPEPIPASLTLTAPLATLSTVGATTQLTVTARFPDGSTREVTTGSSGTNYTTSNRAVATVSVEGVVTAVAPGVVILSALHDGALGLLRLQVASTSGDTDGDGIPDDVEVANGLNPNDPSDAAQDADGDGLTNKQELVDYNTNPRVADTDGDGVRDGLEIQTGSNPLDPGSRNLAQALTAIAVTPTSSLLIRNTIVGSATRQLTVSGHLRDGNIIDLTATATGTTYTSSDPAICDLVGGGRVLAGESAGLCTITATNNGFTASASVTVDIFAPTALSSIAIPGYANNVDVSEDYAYVAAGAAGLQIVDVVNPSTPVIVGALDTPGNANDVRVVGTLAYVADGVAGLQIIDVSTPTAPVLRGTFDTPGEAMDVRVIGTRAYIADGDAGLQIVDVNTPAVPVLLGTVDTSGIARGVDVSDTLAVVADGQNDPHLAGIVTVDVSVPATPQVLARLDLFGGAVDVVLRGTTAYVAGGVLMDFQIVDLRLPASPQLVATLPGFNTFEPADLEIFSRFALAADSLAPSNRMTITDIFDPRAPNFVASIDWGTVGAAGEIYGGTGIALTPQYVYSTGIQTSNGFENGVTGTSRLFIGQYLKFPSDRAGIPPTVRILTPSPGGTVAEGARMSIVVEANDDVAVVAVDILVNGQVVAVGTDFSEFLVPPGQSSLTVGARATDAGGNVGVAAEVVVNVVPDTTPPEVRIATPTAGSTVTEQAPLPVTVLATDNVAVASVDLLVDGQVVQTLTSEPYEFTLTVPTGGNRLTLSARATDTKGNVATAAIEINVEPDTEAPTAQITAPSDGSTVRERSTIGISIDTTDDVAVTAFDLLVNGQVVDTASFGFFTFVVPVGSTSLTLGARARDAAGNVGVATEVVVNVIPDLPPSVEILKPLSGVNAIERTTVRMEVSGSDDVRLSRLDLVVNGEVVASRESSFGLLPPHRFKVPIPVGATTLTLTVRARDNVAQVATSTEVIVNVTPDPGTTMTGRVVDQVGSPIIGARVVCQGRSGLSEADETFTIADLPTIAGTITCVASSPTGSAEVKGGSTGAWAPISGGTIAVGDIALTGVTSAPLYPAATQVLLGTSVTDAAVRDMNRDGHADLIVAGGGIRIYVGNGDGTFPSPLVVPAGTDPQAVAIGDMNGDEIPDLITADGNQRTTSVVLGNGDGTFQAPRSFATRDRVESVTVADFTGDGKLDVLTAALLIDSFFVGEVSLLVGNGDGTLQPRQHVSVGDGPVALAAADLDRDGAMDLIIGNRGFFGGTPVDVQVMLGNGDGSFEEARGYSTGSGLSGLVVTDLDYDGVLDVVTANSGSGDAAILRGNGDGTLQSSVSVPVGVTPDSVIVTDVDFNGVSDLAVTGRGSNFAVVVGIEDGMFASPQQYVVGTGAQTALAVGDLNGDHLPDFVIGRGGAVSPRVALFFHR